eukprot:scaffold8920_cov131-Isochrysis_galbana.AAC.3
MPAAGAVWPLSDGRGRKCRIYRLSRPLSGVQGEGVLGELGAASNWCVSHVGRQTRVAQATAPCRRRDERLRSKDRCRIEGCT